MILAFRSISVLLGFIALTCCYGYLMLLTLIAGPLGIILWYAAKRLDKERVINPLSHTLGWVGIITNGLGLFVSLSFIVIFGMF